MEDVLKFKKYFRRQKVNGLVMNEQCAGLGFWCTDVLIKFRTRAREKFKAAREEATVLYG